MGRPSTFTQETADAICERLADGESLASICRDDAMPGYSTAKRWEVQNDEFRAASLRAREVGCHKMGEDCLEIADDGRNDYMERPENKGGGYEVNGEAIQRSRLRIDTRLRLLGKWLPKVYGDKLELSGDPAAPLQLVTRRIIDMGNVQFAQPAIEADTKG